MLLAFLEWYYGIDWHRLRRASGEVAVVMLIYIALACAITWPTIIHLDEVILGGGELGGWMWRTWWHGQEVDAIGQAELGFFDRLQMLFSLGRYPETGNILDILLLSYPLESLFGRIPGHNLKVLLILVGNGVCGYALARSLTNARLVSLAAGALAIVNPIVIQDINKTGLRQVVLWWLLLYPIFLNRAWRTGGRVSGIAAGLCYVAAAAFYWFYGLFAAMFTLLFVGMAWAKDRVPVARVARWGLPAAVTVLVGVFVFVSPYLSSGGEDTGGGGVAKLPELTFFLPFPGYDTIASAPLRPSNYRENVLSSLHRTIESAWPIDYVLNPRHGVLALPAAAFLLGVLPAIRRRAAWSWLAIWTVFFAGTLGPYLKIGALKDTGEVVTLGEYVVRLPYAWMFQFVPGMSRMFAPYRMGSMVVVASVALLALSLHPMRRWPRRAVGLLAGLAIVTQLFYRFDLDEVGENTAGPAMWRVPTQVSAMKVPEFYTKLDPEGWEGLIELPMEQQQDLICAYQSVHRQKVYRSWATTPAIPPELRRMGGGDPAKRLRWLAKAEPRRDPTQEVFTALSRDPMSADDAVAQMPDDALAKVVETGDYRYLVVHERGYFLLEPQEGPALYRHVVRLLTDKLGVEPTETLELEAFDWPGRERQFPEGPAWIPWASREVQLPTQEMPRRYFMAVFDLSTWTPGGGGGPETSDDTEDPTPPDEPARAP
jgi:hypothetical protein